MIFGEQIALITDFADGDSTVARSTLAEIQGQLLLNATMSPTW